MGRYMRKCKGIMGEIAVMEVTAAHHHRHHEVGVTTRARALAMATTAGASARAQKRKNIDGSHHQEELMVQLRSRRRVLITPDDDVDVDDRNSPVNSSGSSSSGRVIIPSSGCLSPPCSSGRVAEQSPCSSNGSSELVCESVVRSVADLKVEGLEFESSTYSGFRERSSRRETTPSSDLRSESDDQESSMERRPSSVVANSGHRSTIREEDKMPSAAEIEEFFSVAEKDHQKRFADKYNYDVVKDVPLQGRYEWVELKP